MQQLKRHFLRAAANSPHNKGPSCSVLSKKKKSRAEGLPPCLAGVCGTGTCDTENALRVLSRQSKFFLLRV